MVDRLTNAELQREAEALDATQKPARPVLPHGWWDGPAGAQERRWRAAYERERAARVALEAELEAARELLAVAHRRIATLEGR